MTLLLCSIILNKCSIHPLPKQRLSLIKLDIKESYAEGAYQLTIKNPVDCPVRIFLSAQEKEVEQLLNHQSPLLLEAKKDTTVTIKNKTDLKTRIKFILKFGNPS